MENILYQTLSLNQFKIYFPPSWFSCRVQLMTIITPYCNYIFSCFTLKVWWTLWRNNLSTSVSPSLIPTPMQCQELNQNQCTVVWPRDKCTNVCVGGGGGGLPAKSLGSNNCMVLWTVLWIWSTFYGIFGCFQLLFKYNLRENGHFHHYFAQLMSYWMENS